MQKHMDKIYLQNLKRKHYFDPLYNTIYVEGCRSRNYANSIGIYHRQTD